MVIFAGGSDEAPWSPHTARAMILNLKRITVYNPEKSPMVYYIAHIGRNGCKFAHGACRMRLRGAEAVCVDHIVVGHHVHASPGYNRRTEVRKSRHRRAAGKRLLAGRGVEHVQSCVSRRRIDA